MAVKRRSPLQRLRKWRYLARKHAVILNANSVDEQAVGKAALLEYLPEAYLLDASDPAFLHHQNLRRCREMVAILGELGYLVDVSDRRDRTFRPPRDYDLVISERLDWHGIDHLFRADTVRVFLATSTNHVVHNEKLTRRYEWLLERRGRELGARRTYTEKMPALADTHAIVGVGNDFTMGAWRTVFDGPIHPFNNHALEEMPRPPARKDYTTARRAFLFFASRSQVQKGLDLLLEIFPKHPQLHLSVCSQFGKEPDFRACYRKELFKTPNVHPIGWVRIDSPRLAELVETCAYVIHPTCSEGQAGSVVNCMSAGLIPLVTREAGIDTEDFGLTFAGDSLEEIERVVVDVSERPARWHRERAQRTRRVAQERYSEAAFRDRWRAIVTRVVADAAVSEARRRTPR